MRSSTVLLVSSITAAVLYVAAAAVLGTPPDATADGAEVVAWFGAHAGNVRAYAWLLTLLGPVVAAYAALVRDRLPATCSSSAPSPSWRRPRSRAGCGRR